MYPEPFRGKREPGSVVLASFKVTKNASNAASDQSQATKSIIPPYFYHRLVCPKPSPSPPPQSGVVNIPHESPGNTPLQITRGGPMHSPCHPRRRDWTHATKIAKQRPMPG